jgi:hypothetical protein
MAIHDEEDRDDPENYIFRDRRDPDDDDDADESDNRGIPPERRMAKCPNCRKFILEDSPKCPYCKNWVIKPEDEDDGVTTGHKSWVRLTAWILIIIAVIGLISYGTWVYCRGDFYLR